MSIKIIVLCFLIVLAKSEGIYSLYPLANDYFDIIYEIKNNNQSKLHHDQDQSLYLRVYCKDHNVLSVSLTPRLEFVQQPRFPVYSKQSKKIPKFQQQIYTFLSSCNVDVKVHPRAKSVVEIIRRDNNKTIFQLTQVQLSQGYNKFKIKDNSIKWGLGERFQNKFKLTEGLWTIWNRDKPWEIDHGLSGRSSNSYGHQPIYLARQGQSGYTHLTYFKNTHGMQVQTANKTQSLIYHSLGGNIHFLIFIGDKDPQKTLKRYHDFIGGIHIPPFWALGWHQCRWGYQNINIFNSIIQNYNKHDLPLDTMWNDLDYMSHKAIFTIDENNYPSAELKRTLQKNNLHWIPLIDVGVALTDVQSIQLGKSMDVFIKSASNQGQYYIAQVWPGQVHFVDYLHPNASKFWKSQLNRLYKKVPFSGIWLDMNQPSNFRGNQPVNQKYRIQQGQSVNMMTIDVNLNHYSKFEGQEALKHWEVHSYYGHSSVVATFDFLKEHGRPFIISRSNSISTGRYAGHWTGDNSANWDFLRLSISGNFLFQIFGIQMVGADICGFNSDTTEQLCSRWTQLGSLYPFARNHNQDIAKSQQPYVLGDVVLTTAKVSLKQRYSLLKQLYSILVDLNGKGTFFRPIYFQFFEDQQALDEQNIQTEFLLGKYLLSAPIVKQGTIKRNIYFPGNQSQSWYALEYNLQQQGVYRKDFVSQSRNGNSRNYYEGGTSNEVSNLMETSPPLFLRSGYMIFSNKPEQRSRFLNNKYFVTAALNDEGVAINRFLTISNYEDEKILSVCIQKKQCLTQFSLKRIDGNKFELSWKFEGNAQVFGAIELVSIIVWQKQHEFVCQKQNISINTSTGALDLVFKENS